MIEITLILGVAALGYGVAHYFRLPAIPFLLAAGLGLGATTLLGDQAFVEDVLILGAAILLFIAGTNLSARRVGRYKALAAEIGLLQFALLSALGLGVAWALGYALVDSLYVGLALAASSTLVAVRLLQKRKQMFEPFGRAVTGVLLVQDILVVLLIPVLTRAPDGGTAMLLGVGGTLVLVALAALMVRWGAPYLIVELDLDTESILLAVLAVLFAFLGLGALLDLPVISAAFLAGVALSGFPISQLVLGQLQPIYDFFMAVFFTALGVIVIVPGVVAIGHALVFAALVVIITPLAVIPIAERAGLSARSATETGLLIAQTSEFSLVVALQGFVLNQIGADLFATITLVTALTMMLTPFLTVDRLVRQLMRWHPLSREGRRSERQGHAVMLGYVPSAEPVLRRLLELGLDVVVVDEDPGVVDRLREEGVECLRGDAGEKAVLREAGVHRAQVVISTIRRPLEIEPLFDYVGEETPVLARVFEDEEAERIEALGGTPISFSHAAAESFLEWFDKRAGGLPSHGAQGKR